MKILLIGGTGHIASYLLKDLLKDKADITVVSRGNTVPVENAKLYSKVRLHALDRQQAEKGHAWEIFLASQKWDVVVDFISFEPRSAEIAFKTLRHHVKHYVNISTCWMYGEIGRLPALEDLTAMNPGNPYAKKKLVIHRYLMEKFRKEGFPVTTLNPTQITGPGKTCVTPIGNHDMAIFEELSSVKTFVVPYGPNSYVQHVHPKDIAQMILLALQQPKRSIGQMFNAGSAYSMDFPTYARWVAKVTGNARVDLHLMPYSDYLEKNGKNDEIQYHMAFPSCASVEKAKYLLGYKPEFTPEEAVLSCLQWHIKEKRLNLSLKKG